MNQSVETQLYNCDSDIEGLPTTWRDVVADALRLGRTVRDALTRRRVRNLGSGPSLHVVQQRHVISLN